MSYLSTHGCDCLSGKELSSLDIVEAASLLQILLRDFLQYPNKRNKIHIRQSLEIPNYLQIAKQNNEDKYLTKWIEKMAVTQEVNKLNTFYEFNPIQYNLLSVIHFK